MKYVLLSTAILLTPALAGCEQSPTAAAASAGDHAACSSAPEGVAAGAKATAPTSAGERTVVPSQIPAEEVGDVVQQLSFQLCTARANNWIDDHFYREQMDDLRREAFLALGVKLPSDRSAESGKSAKDPSAADGGTDGETNAL